MKLISPHLEVDFLVDSGSRLNVLNNDTWNQFKEYHKLQLKASTFVHSAANNSRLQSNGTIKLTLYPDVSECRTLRTLPLHSLSICLTQNLISLGHFFLEKYVDSIKCTSHTLEFKNNDNIKS